MCDATSLLVGLEWRDVNRSPRHAKSPQSNCRHGVPQHRRPSEGEGNAVSCHGASGVVSRHSGHRVRYVSERVEWVEADSAAADLHDPWPSHVPRLLPDQAKHALLLWPKQQREKQYGWRDNETMCTLRCCRLHRIHLHADVFALSWGIVVHPTILQTSIVFGRTPCCWQLPLPLHPKASPHTTTSMVSRAPTPFTR